MAAITAGELFGVRAPAVGDTVEIPIVLTDDTGAKVTGIVVELCNFEEETKVRAAKAK